MSIRVMTLVWDAEIPEPAQKLVLLKIADNCNDDGGSAWPSVETISRRTSLARRTVQRALRSLEASGLIYCERLEVDSTPRSYRINLPALRSLVPPPPQPRGVKLAPPRSGGASQALDPPCQSDEPPRHHDAQTVLEPSLNRPITKSKGSARAALAPSGTGFDQFWQQYPRKIGKDAARKAWAVKHCEACAGTIVAALTRQLGFLNREQGKYIPNPATWLNQGRWQDEPPATNGHMRGFGKLDMSGIQAFMEGDR